MFPTYMYVDRVGYQCYQHCKEREELTKDSWIIYRCIYCHDKELKEVSCLGTTQYGVRCRSQNVDFDGYCNWHGLTPKDRLVGNLSKVDISLQYEWDDHYKRLAASQLKRSILRTLQFVQNIRNFQLMDILQQLEGTKTNVYFIQCKNYVKIGRSNNPEYRLKTLQNKGNKTLRPSSITDEDMKTAKIIATLKGDVLLEGLFHSKLRDKRVEGEWFILDSYTAKAIELVKNEEFSFETLIKMTEEDPSILNQDYKFSHRMDNSIDEVLEEEEDMVQILKERIKEKDSAGHS
jgi:hypothetical protein